MQEKKTKEKKKRSLLTKLLRIFGWIVVSIIGLVILVLIIIQIPAVQNYARKKVVTYLENKLHTEVQIKKLSVRFPTSLSLQGVFLEDQQKDTLLYGKEIRVNIAMLRLLRNEIRIKEIGLDGIVGKVNRLPPDSTFNFQFIVDAFTSEKTKEPEKEDTSTLNMSIDRIFIDNSHIIYKDLYTGNDLNVRIGHFKTTIKQFDPTHLLFDITLFEVDGLKGYFNQLEPMQKPLENVVREAKAEPEHVMQLFNKTIKLSDIDFQFNSDASHLRSSYVIGKAELHPKKIDLQNMLIAFKDATLEKTNVVIQTNSALPNKPEKIQETDAPPTPSLKIIADELTLKKSSFKMDDIGKRRAAKGMDFSHLFLKDIDIAAKDLTYSSDTMRAVLNKAAFKEQSGFVLNQMHVNFEMNPTGVMLTDLLIKTPGSEISKFAILHYPSLESLSENPGRLGLDVDLQNAVISMADVLTFMPTLTDQLALSPDQSIFVNTRLTGTLNSLEIGNLVLRGLSATRIDLQGHISGLPETDQLRADLDIATFQTNRKDLNTLLPAGTVPPNIQLPDRIALNGQLKGGIQQITAKLNVNTNLGDANLNATATNITDKYKAVYTANVRADKLQLGTILKNPELGLFSGTLKANGRGYDPHTADATFNINIPAVDYHKYRYRNITADGSIDDGDFKTDLAVRDPNLTTKMSISGSFLGKFPAVSLDGVIDSIDVQALNLSSETLKYHGRISADFKSTNPDSLDGNLFITNSILVNKNGRVTLDTVSVIADIADSNRIFLTTGFASLTLQGDYKLTELGDVFTNAINPYYQITDQTKPVATAPYDFTLRGIVLDNPKTRAVIPGLKDLQTIHLDARFASDSGWRMNIESPHIAYKDMVIDDLILKAATGDSALAFDVDLGQFSSGKSIRVYQTALTGKLDNNKANVILNIQDQKSKVKYHLRAVANQAEGGDFVFSLIPDSLRLNYDPWKVDPQNQIVFGKDGIRAQNFTLSQEQQQLSIHSESQAANSPLLVDFKNFKIATLTGFVQTDSLLVNGLLNGHATVKNLTGSPVFITDLTVQDLSVYKDTLGNLTAKVDNQTANQYHADIQLKGNGNDVAILGDYFLKPKNSSFDFNLKLNQFQMNSLVGLTNGAIKRAEGFLYGNVAVSGSLDEPNIDGRIQFNNTSFVPATLNNVFKIDKEAIAIINNKGVVFNSFTIRDTANNTLTLAGQVNTEDWMSYTFDMNIKADNFQAINSTKRDNDLFYGRFVFSTNLNVKGTPTEPVVDGTLTVNENTDFTVVLPTEDPGVEKREGIVRFVDYSATAEDSLFMSPFDSLKTAPFVGYDVAVNITIDKKAEFNMIVDPANGDFLNLRGDGQLTGGIDPSGKINLTGSYEIEEGSYSLSFNFLKRKFDIQKGSRIVWTGDPTSAQVDVTAVYITNTAPYDLVAGLTEGNDIYYKQKLPFEVHLNMDGELLKPTITFDIVLPDKTYTVSATVVNTVKERLMQIRQEPSELNKQVFALLLLNRFVGENPFNNSSSEGLSAGTFAKQSASRLLTEQLNNLAEGLIQGVDVNFDLATTEDYTTGQKRDRTDFKVNVSKSLLNDRLTVTVGNNFELEGPQPTNQQHSGIADNISINYKLSKDGRYMLRAYRKNDYTGALEGYVVETGVGFIITLDYNKFSNLFKSKAQREKRREIKRENKQLKKENEARREEDQQEMIKNDSNDETND